MKTKQIVVEDSIYHAEHARARKTKRLLFNGGLREAAVSQRKIQNFNISSHDLRFYVEGISSIGEQRCRPIPSWNNALASRLPCWHLLWLNYVSLRANSRISTFLKWHFRGSVWGWVIILLAILNGILQKLFHLQFVWDACENTEYLKHFRIRTSTLLSDLTWYCPSLTRKETESLCSVLKRVKS